MTPPAEMEMVESAAQGTTPEDDEIDVEIGPAETTRTVAYSHTIATSS